VTRARLAPVLSALLEDLDDLAHGRGKKPHPKASKEGDRRVVAFARAELRALLAVARAAQRATGGVELTPELDTAWPETAALVRALARLAGLSRDPAAPTKE
jgi:hypothetical protein